MPRCRQTLNDETMILFLDNNQLFDQTFSYLERNMAHNEEAGRSGGKQFWELSQEMEEEPHHYEDAVEDTDPDYTTPSGVGDDTTDGAAEDATTDDGGAHTDGNQSKKQRKDRRPNVLRTVTEEFTQVDSDGKPTEPKQGVLGSARVHSPEHRLDQHREPEAS